MVCTAREGAGEEKLGAALKRRSRARTMRHRARLILLAVWAADPLGPKSPRPADRKPAAASTEPASPGRRRHTTRAAPGPQAARKPAHRDWLNGKLERQAEDFSEQGWRTTEQL